MDLKPILDIGELQGIRNYHYTIQGLLSTSGSDTETPKFEEDYGLGLHRANDPLISAAPRSFSPLLDPAVFPIEDTHTQEIKVVAKQPTTSWTSATTSHHHSGKRKQRRYRCTHLEPSLLVVTRLLCFQDDF